MWRASLDLGESRVHALLATLAQDERERAERFHFATDRARFIAGRGLLRAILARYLQAHPASLRFHYSPRGKPALTPDSNPGGLQFNVAHSHGIALYAFARGRALGVDLECIQPQLQEGIAERFFSAREVAALRALPADLRAEAFFACWTRKEAYVKAMGDGLALPLDQFDVSLAPGEPAALLRTAGNPQEACRWRLQALEAAPGYAGAICVEGHDWRLTCWQWPEGTEGDGEGSGVAGGPPRR